MNPDEIPALLADLSELHGWRLTATETLQLRAAIAGHDRMTISDAARGRGQLQPADLITALNRHNTATQAGQEATMGRIPWHTPDCQCGGTGTIEGHVVGTRRIGGRDREYTGPRPCEANQGQPITAAQYAAHLQRTPIHRNTDHHPKDTAARYLDEARGRLKGKQP